ncbi:hypothetical protein [Rhodococcoides kyotonense]|uniref:Uncharacterized protein n=1 Tax=Rhodococcoides kyotonense TaxID=398843 RepID=A0A239IYT5_9NOCA|nr:hypothetical protein [Rhodococcus kyotonensis]SNS98153.1 hypothetical protein SAMN05421642_107271 [Rhodococcus kyotonensis]
MSITDDAQQRVQVQELSGALMKLNTADATAASLLTKLFHVVAEEAARTPRFAKALATAFAVAPSEDGPVAKVAETKAPARKRAAPAKKPAREPGVFDPFVVLRDEGEEHLTTKLSELTVDQLRDIIAEQEIDTRRETGRKRKAEVLVEWTVDRVKALANKGSVFR